MLKLWLNGVEVNAEEDWTLLDTAKFYGINIPTLCYYEGLTPYGVCRLCVVEIGKGDKTKLVTACTHPVWEGLEVKTHTPRVMKARKMVVELLLARCPTSKVLQDLAAKLEVKKVRFKPKNDDCILCGLCVRICEEQMDAGAIGFVDRGSNRKITTPFDIKSEVCRTCGACEYICPACQLRCHGPEPPGTLCGGCMNFSPPCVEEFDNAMCYLDPCVACLKDKVTEKDEKSKDAQEKETA